MATAKTTTERIAETKEKIEQLEKKKKKLEQAQNAQERKARTKRLCRRGGYLEKILPDTITLTDEQFDLFLDKTLLTDFTRRTLANILIWANQVRRETGGIGAGQWYGHKRERGQRRKAGGLTPPPLLWQGRIYTP